MPYRCIGNGPYPRLAVEQVLCCIVGCIANKPLRVDDKPRFALRSHDITGMQVGGQQDIVGRWSRKLFEEAETLFLLGPRPAISPCPRSFRPPSEPSLHREGGTDAAPTGYARDGAVTPR